MRRRRSNRVAIAALSFLITNGFCFAQVTVQIASASAIAGGTGSANISISTTSGSAPASVQWKLTYSQADISGMTLVPAAAATSAGKTLTCISGTGSVECIISGLNTAAIPNGIIATAQFRVPASAGESSSLGITGVVAASASGIVLPATGVGGTLTVAQAVQPSTLTCSPQTLITPATASCIVKLTSAPTNTISLTLGDSVSNAEITMPSSINVPAGATSASFNVQAAAVSAKTSLIVTASLNSRSISFTMSLQPSSSPAFTPIRVDSGGAEYTDPSGAVWSADTGYSGGGTYHTTNAISNTSTPPLYQSERYGNFRYQFDVPNGTHTVTLKFAEIYWSKPGERVFDVAINGTTVLSNFDIIKQAGAAFKALDESFSVPVSTGTITITFTTVVNNAKISAIEIQ
jgi:hypothetical protein